MLARLPAALMQELLHPCRSGSRPCETSPTSASAICRIRFALPVKSRSLWT
jgi:hypothetical protein